MRNSLFFTFVFILGLAATSCKETTQHTEDYGVVEITGKVRDSQGVALAGIKVTGRESTESKATISTTTNSAGEYTLKGETTNLKGFTYVVQVSDQSNKFLSKAETITIVSEDFSGSYRNDPYYQGTARKKADFYLLFNDLN